jgi:hypothetical protein
MKSCFANHAKAGTWQNSYQPITPQLQAVILAEVCPAAAVEVLTVAAIQAVAVPVDFSTQFIR